MRFLYGLSAAIVGVAIAIVRPAPVAALTAEEVEAIAEEITVLIPTKRVNSKGELREGNGSGSIIAREGNTYTVLTANHVVCRDQNPVCQKRYDEIKVVTRDGREYPVVQSTIKKLPGVDLAVFEFTSSENYRLATLGNYDLLPEQFVFASGWPALNRYVTERERHFSVGKVLPEELASLLKIFPPSYGYEMVYSSITYGGMSGGPVLDTNGRTIAIHGQNEGERIQDESSGGRATVYIGFSVAIPIETFFRLAPQAGIEGNWQEASEPPAQMEIEEIGAMYYEDFEEPDENSTNAIDWVNYGNRMWRRGNPFLALVGYDRALEINPNLYQAWYGKGLVLTYWRQAEQALEAYDEALELNPNSRARDLREKLQEHLSSANP